jgi:DNA-binding LytR/AlgR family response regulator
MIKVIALDDEPPALDLVGEFCKKLPDVQLLGKFTRTSEALAFLNDNPVDLILLDINMPSVTGIEFYKRLISKPMAIFLTSYSEYAVESYNVNAVDYLLKPFTFARFSQAIDKALTQKRIQQQETKEEKSLILRLDYGLVKIPMVDILFIEGLDNYMKIHLDKQKPLTVRTTMKTLQDMLPANEFVRVHRSYIVSLSHLGSVRKKIITIGGEEVPIGSSYEENFNTLLKLRNPS